MEDEWDPLLSKDCMLFTSNGFTLEDDFQLTSLDYTPPDKIIKTEPAEETSDYHGSTSGSPSSSLSSPDMKDNLCVDLSFMPFGNNVHPFLQSPTSSSGSPFGQMLSSGSITQQHSPLPPVSHFSHQMTPHQEQQRDQRSQHQQTHQQTFSNPSVHHVQTSMTPFNSITPQETITFFDTIEDRTPSPPTSERSSPANGMMINNVVYGACNPSPFTGNPGMMGSLSAAQQQLKSRSKMHEMAVRQRLITDQDPRSQGLVQLSAEERRTLLQEGYPVPTRLPLSKAEEESLKIVRRKIKNKLSAQESRRKRKEYMDTLESRCQAYFNENSQLKNRVRQLEASNQKLSNEVKKLRELMGNGTPHSDLPVAH